MLTSYMDFHISSLKVNERNNMLFSAEFALLLPAAKGNFAFACVCHLIKYITKQCTDFKGTFRQYSS